MTCNKTPVYAFRHNEKTFFLCLEHAEQVGKLIEMGVFYGNLIPLDRNVSEVLSCSEKVTE